MIKTAHIAIIILHYNAPKFTLECLRSLENLSTKYAQFSVIVVDNFSQEIFAQPKTSYELKVLRTDQNLGFTGGNNVGIRYAFEHLNPDHILLLNNDTTVSPDFLDKLVGFAQTHTQVGAITPKIYFEKGCEFHKSQYTHDELGKVIWFAGGSIDWRNVYGFHRGVDEVDRGQFDLPVIERSEKQMPYYGYQTMDFASGCCVLIPAAVLKQVGLFDESYFLYWEDADLSMRIRQAGFQLYFCPQSVIWHKNAGSTGGSGSKLQQYYQKRNRLKFALKYAPLRSKLAVLKQSLLNR